MASRKKNRPHPTLILPSSVRFRPRRVRRVDFVVGGVQKAGTTALHDFLRQHPHVALLRDQALHFFDDEKKISPNPDYEILHHNFAPGWRWRIAGEVTADYLYYPQALDRIARYNRRMKLIFSLRNPADRAFSHWNMRRAKNREQLEFLDAMEHDREMGIWRGPRGNGYIARGLYSVQLERLFNLFPREQLLILKFENFRDNPFREVDRLFDFLGVRRLPGIKDKRRNVGAYTRKMTAREREHVSDMFEEDISKVESMLGWNCDDWRFQPATASVAVSP